MIKPQYVYKAVNFIFENNAPPKPKYFVVFHCDEESTLLFSLTTGRSKLPANLDQAQFEGCVQFNDARGYGHSFIWNSKRVLGTNGFCFEKRTYIQLEFKAQLKEVNSSSISRKAPTK